MFRVICPNCRKEDIAEVINVIPGRKYELQCRRCGNEFIMAANEAKGQQSEKLGSW